MKTYAFSIFLIAYILNYNIFSFLLFLLCVCGQMFVGFLHLNVELDIVLRCKIAVIKCKHLHHI